MMFLFLDDLELQRKGEANRRDVIANVFRDVTKLRWLLSTNN